MHLVILTQINLKLFVFLGFKVDEYDQKALFALVYYLELTMYLQFLTNRLQTKPKEVILYFIVMFIIPETQW